MAKNTAKSYRNQVMYCVFVRSHTPEGTFEGVRRDLERIKELGVDVIWLMPIHPVGEQCRKGSLGSPYAIRDYRAVDPEYGTLEDFQRLVDAVHQMGMKCIIDVVYNHTSPDSVLAREHPEWFYRRPDGSFGNRVGDWWDVIDLDYSQPGLWDYQIETLKYWASMVDGFRCDVAPLVPLEFWLRAREEVERVRPGCLWLAESVEPAFIREGRAAGLGVLSDAELYQAFDICYDYDIFDVFQDYLEGKVPLERYAQAVNAQETIYPDNYVKLRFLENHDRARAAFLIPEGMALMSWTAFLYFQKGTTLLYAGQEAECTHRPSLFDKDETAWHISEGVTRLLRTLAKLKRNPILTDSRYEVKALPQDILCATHRKGDRQLVGLFSVKGNSAPVRVEAPDGFYPNLLDENGREVEVYGGMVSVKGAPIVFEAPWTGDKPN
ncbi:MAG: alpha-amylase [Oscillospiraceae bacterium]|nr:alpha-amylase [Oscillospiraceae bacterium]MCI9548680.1 alpha-amylase [Oscillospiraceae bacterium]